MSMLPPIPHSLAPVTAQQDVPKPRPDIPPVTPPSESAKESAIELDRRHPQEAEMLLYEEQRRRQRRLARAIRQRPARDGSRQRQRRGRRQHAAQIERPLGLAHTIQARRMAR